MKFYECSHCHNIIAYVKNSGVPVICCGEPMKELVPNRPVAEFRICEDDEVVAAYEYCTLHGLWKAEA